MRFLLLAFLFVCSAFAQKPSFEVAAIRKADPNPRMIGMDVSPSGQVHFRALSVKNLVSLAYGAKNRTISGEPRWADTETFDIDARVDEELAGRINALPMRRRMELLGPLLQGLLEERFHLKLHREMKEMPVYALTVAKGGVKMTPSPATTTVSDEGGALTVTHGQWNVRRMSMAGWAANLSYQPDVDRLVVDETGLKDVYDFGFKWSGAADEGTTIFTAVEEQLGLKMVPKKAPMEMFVVDSVEEPTGN